VASATRRGSVSIGGLPTIQSSETSQNRTLANSNFASMADCGGIRHAGVRIWSERADSDQRAPALAIDWRYSLSSNETAKGQAIQKVPHWYPASKSLNAQSLVTDHSSAARVFVMYESLDHPVSFGKNPCLSRSAAKLARCLVASF
jgi:hypothetical protein